MRLYKRIALSKEIDVTKNIDSKVCIVSVGTLIMGSNYKNLIAGCHNLLMICTNISDIAVNSVKSVACCCIIFDTSDASNLLRNFLLDDFRYI